MCRLLFLGVHGFIAYEDIGADLCRAVRSLVEGHFWVAREVLEQFAGYVSGIPRLRLAGEGALSRREQSVLGLLERRMSDKEIAAAIAITARTVRFHVQSIFSKLGVHDRYAVAELARSGHLAGPQQASADSRVLRVRGPSTRQT